METVETSEFKVGNTTFNSHYFITIPDYGVSIPECHSTGPIINPICVPLTTIVNFIERGLHPQFKDESKCESIYYFLVEYNLAAAKINNEAGEILNPIAQKAEDYFLMKLNYNDAMTRKRERAESNNPFTKKIVKSNTDIIGSGYSNEYIANKFKKKSNKPKKFVDNRSAPEHKMFDMFSLPGAVTSDGKIVLDPNTIGGNTMPEFFDEMDLDS